ncbi:MAG: substrate-binding domain-containing protein [Gammaproteobacteria bacterium]|nr:substrate-binding domain-containing protein [Gammaproteobacteria bacterium]
MRATEFAWRRALGALLALLALAAQAADRSYLLLQSTTSTQASGLFDALLPRFTAATGIEVHVIAVGTGQALANCRAGNGDLALVHAPDAEARFIADGEGLAREPLMYNDFVLVGPVKDPAGVRGAPDAAEAFRRIAVHGALFASRGDLSGTHVREQALWKAAGHSPDPALQRWYRDTGSGMLSTLNVARELGAYTLTDSASWATYTDRQGLAELLSGDPALRNQYSLILVDPRRHPHVHAVEARRLQDWLLGTEGQAAIAAFRPQGRQLFIPNANTRPPTEQSAP